MPAPTTKRIARLRNSGRCVIFKGNIAYLRNGSRSVSKRSSVRRSCSEKVALTLVSSSMKMSMKWSLKPTAHLESSADITLPSITPTRESKASSLSETQSD